MRKPSESSSIDDFTPECQALNRSLYALEEGDTFGDSDDERKIKSWKIRNYQTMTAAQMMTLTLTLTLKKPVH